MGISSRPRSGRDLFGNQQQHYHKRIVGPGGSSIKRSMKQQIATSQSQASNGSRAIFKRKRTTADSLSPEKEGGKLKSPTRRRKQKKKNGEEEKKKHAKRKQVATAEISPDSPSSPSSSDDDTDDEEYSAYEEKRQKKQRQKLKTAARPSATPPPVAAVVVVGPVKSDVGEVEKKYGNAELSEKKRGAMKTIHAGTDLGMGAEVEGYLSE